MATLIVAMAAKANGQVTVMSRNIYIGADLTPVITAVLSGDEQRVSAAVTTAYAHVLASNFPERAEAIAMEIERTRPALVGLQEVMLFRSGVASDPAPADVVELDFLSTLVAALDGRGLHYAPVATVTNTDAEFAGLIGGSPRDVRTTDRDVILARTDLPTTQLTVANAQQTNFATNLVLPVGATGSITVFRGWTAVDVNAGGLNFRLVNTHLDPTSPVVQVAQANELLAGPASTPLPLVFVGDYNSPADGTGSATYGNLIAAGFQDSWSQVHPGDSGYTSTQNADLMNPTSLLSERIDLVLHRGGLSAISAELVGEDLADRTPSGLWPSDHAGIAATLIPEPTTLSLLAVWAVLAVAWRRRVRR
jgi:endonuclease/exonuclease/phosphatase family protein/PEP-CTERM motif-containing protein